MLREVILLLDGDMIFRTTFGKSLDPDALYNALRQLLRELASIKEETKTFDFFRFKFVCLVKKDLDLVALFVMDKHDEEEDAVPELKRFVADFLSFFEDSLDQIDSHELDVLQPTVELIYRNLKPKVSLVGYSGVGKTTITRLITEQEIPMEHIPTITGDIGTIQIGKLQFSCWDFAGQDQFEFLWKKFILGSDAVLLITDSTLENCTKSTFFVQLVKSEAPTAHLAVIGNKQDLPGALPLAKIEEIVGVHAYSMVATDPNNRERMIQIIADILEISPEMSPLLKPLIQRDEKIAEAEAALRAGDLERAADLFYEISDFCLELGDDSMSREFYERAEKLKG
ncbi:MAG: hypothetical protein Kow0069_38660 [Promethearchaeota archaeon]